MISRGKLSTYAKGMFTILSVLIVAGVSLASASIDATLKGSLDAREFLKQQQYLVLKQFIQMEIGWKDEDGADKNSPLGAALHDSSKFWSGLVAADYLLSRISDPNNIDLKGIKAAPECLLYAHLPDSYLTQRITSSSVIWDKFIHVARVYMLGGVASGEQSDDFRTMEVAAIRKTARELPLRAIKNIAGMSDTALKKIEYLNSAIEKHPLGWWCTINPLKITDDGEHITEDLFRTEASTDFISLRLHYVVGPAKPLHAA